ncbi:hypothetical protein [Opitutus sp. ER46]|uniref:hypothetical protein n=1 Tax=Opitutus sp. ER46 TaxID=2161864 RepID=UPI000D3004A8|nr:hypothetical protein [Opitutus sp. ER46]PTX94372.1 hypothetical protein DB354_11500 [Opitutus sp. ER46]
MTNLQFVQKQHRELFQAFCQDAYVADRRGFTTKLNQLLATLSVAAGETHQPEDYLWCRGALEQWRTARPALGEVVDIALPPPPTFASESESGYADLDLDERVRRRADELGRERIKRWHDSRSASELAAIYLRHVGGEEAHRRQDEDWARAETRLAWDVIHREIDLVHDLRADSYWRIEGKDGRMWLSRVVELGAYLIWEGKGRGWGTEQAVSDYQAAEGVLWRLINDHSHKAARLSFEPVSAYLHERYIDPATGKIRADGPMADWIQVKTERLMAKRHYTDRDIAAQKVIQCVEGFYEHIAPAVLGGSEASAIKVQEALGLRFGFEENREVTNCFEFAVAVYFLNGPTV